ncbi:MAG: tol-pal system protein YbgF [Deltaproteobacteria bacterium]|nr:tol-pal system protein YbgF [Deltaproteobacteria bacterium]MBI4196202.1 tol-pal system protein YbgF [Deltaproteobacteria bacterium]
MKFGAPLFFVLLMNLSVYADSSKKKIEELERIQESNAKILAEVRQEITELKKEFQVIRGLAEETKHFFEEGAFKNQKFLRDYDYRLIGIEERLSLQQKALGELLTRSRTSNKKEGVNKAEEGEYKKALSEINLGNYQEALKLFDEFLKKFPYSTLSDNAQYWKGEALYASRDFPGALLEFQKVLEKYPESDKAPAALLKQGFCLYEQKAFSEAAIFLKKVVQRYPRSDEAAEAKERLKKIQEQSSPEPVASGTPAATEPKQETVKP